MSGSRIRGAGHHAERGGYVLITLRVMLLGIAILKLEIDAKLSGRKLDTFIYLCSEPKCFENRAMKTEKQQSHRIAVAARI